MNKFHAIAVTPTKMGFTVKYIEFEAATEDFSIALFALVESHPKKYSKCYFLSADNYSPITFDCSMQLMNGLNKPYPSDRYEFTYNKFVAMAEECEKQNDFVSISSCFCRTHECSSGKAGEFFNSHDADFGRFRKEPKAPFCEHGIFNEPKFYLENRNK